MEQHEPPPPRSYIAQALINLLNGMKMLLNSAIRTADDSKRAPGASPPLFVDKAGRPKTPVLSSSPAPLPPAAPGSSVLAGAGAPTPRAEEAAASPTGHQHGALVGLAEGLERTVLQPLASGGGKGALAHEEMEAERVGDPFRRTITAT